MRPLLVFSSIATAMVVWFAVRMLGGASYDVWRVSCLLGAWAPVISAGLYLYVREVGEREDSVFAAWLVRAIGMHFVLAWMLGMTDWLRGPPGTPRVPNADMIAPPVLIAFVPAFMVCLLAFRWLLSVRGRLVVAAPVATRTIELDAGHAPYRGVGRLRVTEAVTAFPTALLVSSVMGAGAVWFALAAPMSTVMVMGVTAVALGVVSSLGAAAVTPSVASIGGVAAALMARGVSAQGVAAVPSACAWPWLAVAGVMIYAATVEARMRVVGVRG